jgi:hypothetical protein
MRTTRRNVLLALLIAALPTGLVAGGAFAASRQNASL